MNLEEHKRWLADKGDATLRLNYDLNADSVVIDAGGFKGDWAASINDKYGCHVFIYEPVEDYFNGIQNRFSANDKVHQFHYGLGGGGRNEMISLTGDEASIFTGEKSEQIYIADIVEELPDRNIEHIDLIKINIEGGEYELLDAIIDSGIIDKIENIQVQFHYFVPGAVEKRDAIRAKLKLTHKCEYNYEFVWESWKK